MIIITMYYNNYIVSTDEEFMKTKSKFIRNLSCSQITECSQAGSSNVGEYEKDDGSSYYFCYKCNKPLKCDIKPVDGHQGVSTADLIQLMPKGEKVTDEPIFKPQGILDRNIKQSTLEKYGVKIALNGAHYYPYGKDAVSYTHLTLPTNREV